MILYEFEGKQLLKGAGIKVPLSQLISSPDESINLDYPLVLKAQVLSGKRAEAGGIIAVNSRQETVDRLKEMFGKEVNKEKVEKILVEEKIEIEAEYYLSISYDTDTRGPVLTVSESGGTGVEEHNVKTFPVDPITRDVIASDSEAIYIQKELLNKLINLFFEQDCLLLEINPLVKTRGGPSTSLGTVALSDWIALDAKLKLDETASNRHPEWESAGWLTSRSVGGYSPSEREIEAKKIDQGDYRGTAGSTYFDFDGDIAILASGGGASLTAMDALIKVGGKPANYTEYSGNPPKEKVTKLTKIVLSKPGINGLWVVGAYANFTDIYETLTGFVEGLRQAQTELNTKFNFPIVIRRGGPRYLEAFEMLRKVSDFNIKLLGPEISITKSAQIVADLSKQYASSR